MKNLVSAETRTSDRPARSPVSIQTTHQKCATFVKSRTVYHINHNTNLTILVIGTLLAMSFAQVNKSVDISF